ncbi:MAG TPA: UbiD family decarboxylase [Chloroflexota bacterium]|nr:UbiD family decarboxylase [Chloroflexota bacterium]
MPKSLHSFLDELRDHAPEDLLHIDKKVDPNNFDVTAILEHLAQKRRVPTTLFHKPLNQHQQESAFPIVGNVFGTRERIARAIGVKVEDAGMELALEYARLEREKVTPVTVGPREAPVQQVVHTGAEADVAMLPIVRHFEMDMGPVLTMAAAMKDPDEDFYNVSFIKLFYIDDPRHCAVSIHPGMHLHRILTKYEEHGQPAPVALILGHHPAFYLGALALAEFGENDYEIVGSFLGEACRLVPSTTWGSDFMIPADAEIVLEGEIKPGAKEVVDPFGEVTRHYQAQCIRQGIDVTAINHRRDAIMQDVFSGHQEHWNLGGVPKEGTMFNDLQRRHGCIKAVHLPHSGCSRFLAYVSIKKEREGIAKRVGLDAMLQAPFFNVVVVVDEDIDVFNEQDVMWSVLTNMDPSRDVDLLKNVYNLFTTHMLFQKMVIDATRPLDIAFPMMARVPESAMKRIRLEDFMEGI